MPLPCSTLVVMLQGKMVLGVNAYREICTLHLAGQILVDKKLVLRLAAISADRQEFWF